MPKLWTMARVVMPEDKKDLKVLNAAGWWLKADGHVVRKKDSHRGQKK